MYVSAASEESLFRMCSVIIITCMGKVVRMKVTRILSYREVLPELGYPRALLQVCTLQVISWYCDVSSVALCIFVERSWIVYPSMMFDTKDVSSVVLQVRMSRNTYCKTACRGSCVGHDT